ncbi:basic helix-loop-helix domain-containing protein [Dankookia rubra]|nr:hypothetical protein [Dankookia rubra]
MNVHAEKPIIRSVRQGESIKLPVNGPTLQEITCDDIARLALAMHDHEYFFSLRRGLRFNFSRDLNGSGIQGLYIRRESDGKDTSHLFEIIFDYTLGKDDNFLYEADLIKDHGKDYEPSINCGKTRFVARSATIRIDWNSDEAQEWRSDIERLSRSPDTLTEWIEEDSEMLVRCGSTYFCRKPAILTINDLRRHVAAGMSLKDLTNRLKCSKCGKRGARVTVF